MDYFGINSADELPRINEVLADQIVAPTLVNADHFEVEEGAVLAVSEDGELINKAIEDGAADEIIEIVEETTPDQEPQENFDVADDAEQEETGEETENEANEEGSDDQQDTGEDLEDDTSSDDDQPRN
jgi:segregation and condensation protein B